MSTLSTIWAISLSSLVSSASSPIFINEIVDYKFDSYSPVNHQVRTSQNVDFRDSEINIFSVNSSLDNSANGNLSSDRNNDLSTDISNDQNRPRYLVEFQVTSDDKWMINVNRQSVFLVGDMPSAAIATAKLAIIMNHPDFDPQLIVPAVVDNPDDQDQPDQYVGKYKDVTLFTIPRASVVNPSLNLTQWVNNLRVAANAEPLTLIESQKQMHQLNTTVETLEGIASWYGPYFQGRLTASGEYFEQQDFTAAHPSLPFDTYLKVTNQRNGKSVIVRINDRGPYFGDRNLDLSHAAAIALDSDEVGVVPVTATILASN